VSEQHFRIDDGPLQGWYVGHHLASIQFRALDQSVTMVPPVQPDGTLRVDLRLTIRPGDPQWEVAQTLGRQQLDTGTAREIRAIALGLLLPRVHAGLAVRDGWHVQRGSSVTPAINGRLTDLDGPQATIRIIAADSTRRGDGSRRLATRLQMDGLEATFGWVRQQVLQHPGLPAAQTRVEWSEQATRFLQTPLPGQPHPGQYVLDFVNATGGHGHKRKITDSLAEAQALAATHRPFNNTRVAVEQVIGIDNGMAVTAPVSLDSTARPGRGRAVAAFPQPPAAQRTARPHPTPGPTSASPGRTAGPHGTRR
jgi:hypothetical protein